MVFLLLLVLALSFLFNIERLDFNNQNSLNLQSFIYLLAPIAVMINISIPFFSKHRIFWGLGFWLFIYVILKISLNGNLAFLNGIQLYLTMTEIFFMVGISTISQKLGKEIQIFRKSVEQTTVLMAGRQIKNIENSNKEIHREMTRSRQYERPISVIVVKPATQQTDLNVDDMLKEIQKETAVHYMRAKMVKTLQNQLRLMDMVLLDDDSEQFVIICPEVNDEGTKPVIAKLSNQLNKMGIDAKFSSATFPEEGLTFAGLINEARKKINRASDSL